jgi:erythromycin esterase
MQQKEKKPMKKWKKRLLISVATIAVIAIGLGLFINNWMAVENSKVPLPTFNWQAKKIDNAQLNQFTKDNSVFIPLNQQVDSITTAELKGLDTWVGNAKYIGLGEVTHGSVENFVLKTKLVQYLVENKGAKAIALEAGIADCYKLNQYITTGIGDPRQLLIDIGIFSMRYKEYVDLFNYLKKYNENKSASEQVEILGYDIQTPQSSAKLILQYLNTCQTNPDKDLQSSFEKLASDGRSMQALNPFSVWFGYEKQTEKMLEFFNASQNALVNKSSQKDFDFHKRLVGEMSKTWSLFYSSSAMKAFFKRDEFGYENIKWLAETQQKYPIIILAHNAHVQRKDFIYKDFTPTGAFFNKNNNNEYFSIGSVFYEGEVRAEYKGKIENVKLPQVENFCAENYFNTFGHDIFLLNIQKAKAISALKNVLTDSVAIRSIGSSYQPDILGRNERVTIFDQQYDALLFFKKSTAPKDIK